MKGEGGSPSHCPFSSSPLPTYTDSSISPFGPRQLNSCAFFQLWIFFLLVLATCSPKSETKGLQWPFVSCGQVTPDLTFCNLSICEFLNHMKTFQQSNFPATERLSACVELQEVTRSFVWLGAVCSLVNCPLKGNQQQRVPKCLWSKNG